MRVQVLTLESGARLGRKIERAKFFMSAANAKVVRRVVAERALADYNEAVEQLLTPCCGGEAWDVKRS